MKNTVLICAFIHLVHCGWSQLYMLLKIVYVLPVLECQILGLQEKQRRGGKNKRDSACSPCICPTCSYSLPKT